MQLALAPHHCALCRKCTLPPHTGQVTGPCSPASVIPSNSQRAAATCICLALQPAKAPQRSPPGADCSPGPHCPLCPDQPVSFHACLRLLFCKMGRMTAATAQGLGEATVRQRGTVCLRRPVCDHWWESLLMSIPGPQRLLQSQHTQCAPQEVTQLETRQTA